MLPRLTLSGTDLDISPLCYGTNMLGTAIDQAGANAILDRFAEVGGNFLDTARSYGDWVPDAPAGASERALGTWLAGRDRADFVIATKGGFYDLRAGDYRSRVNPVDLERDLSASLDHLGIATIDLYWVHMDDPASPVAPIIDMLNGARDAGRVRAFGASNWTAARVAEANDYARQAGLAGFAAVQCFWGLAKPNADNAAQQGYQLYFEDRAEEETALGLPVISYCSQSRGYLSLRDEGAVPDHIAAFYDNPANTARFEAAKRVAARHGVEIGDVVLAYLLNQPGQVVPIFGASSPARIDESVRAVGLTLSTDELAELAA